MKVFTALVLLALSAQAARADCCSRKGDFGCCGNGPCNIFCCNCDNSCNQQCENTHCDTGEWFECAGVVTACATACVVTEGEACAECMGSLYDTCKKCYSSSSVAATGPVKTHATRQVWFEEISGGSAKCITFEAFVAYVQTVAASEAAGTTKGNRGSRIVQQNSFGSEFASLDVNGDGCIDRVEFA